jgi:hypothetical protein
MPNKSRKDRLSNSNGLKKKEKEGSWYPLQIHKLLRK